MQVLMEQRLSKMYQQSVEVVMKYAPLQVSSGPAEFSGDIGTKIDKGEVTKIIDKELKERQELEPRDVYNAAITAMEQFVEEKDWEKTGKELYEICFPTELELELTTAATTAVLRTAKGEEEEKKLRRSQEQEQPRGGGLEID